MVVVKISSKGQITIPVSIRNKLKLSFLRKTEDFILKILQCLHLNGQKKLLQVKHRKQDLKQRMICRSI